MRQRTDLKRARWCVGILAFLILAIGLVTFHIWMLSQAKTKENISIATAAAVIARLETALTSKDKFQAEDILAELDDLFPTDARMAGLREKVNALREEVNALPGPKQLSVDLGGVVKMRFVLIQPGTFTMGPNFGGDETAHKVTLTKPYYIGKYEVTQEQWHTIMGNNPSTFKGAKNPVENVSWDDCQNFLAKLNEKIAGQKFSLPTEAQWGEKVSVV
jgi:formylglycine-generating enzyme required for sulfatase activity